MKKRQLLATCMGIIAITSVSSAYAIHRPNSVVLTGAAGYEHFSPKHHYINGYNGFGAVEYDFTANWGLSATVGGFGTHFRQRAADGYRKHAHGVYTLLDAVYNFTPALDFFQPFLMAGFGMSHFSRNHADAANQGNINAGVGVDMFANKSVAFRLEGVNIFSISSHNTKNDQIVDAGVSFFIDLC